MAQNEPVTDETANLVIEHLRYLRGKLDRVADDVVDVKARLNAVERAVARLAIEVGHTNEAVAGLQGRMDRFEVHLDRIERRLDIADAPIED